MTLPKAVQKQADEADRLMKEMQQGGESDESTSSDEQAVVESPAVKLEESPSIPDWEHKFSVLQGKYNAELPRLNQDLHNLRDQNLKLQDENTELKKVPEKPRERPDFTEVREDLGDGAADAFAKQQETIDKQNQLIDEMRKQMTQIGQNTQQSSEQMFYSTLHTLVPELEALNKDPKFSAWLGETDIYSGKTRQQLLNEAASTLDVNRTASFFTQWKKLTTNKKSGIEKQVTPRTNQTTTVPKGQQTYTRADVKKFYDDVARGKYRNNQEQMKATDVDITRAQSEGRIAA